LAFRGHYEHSLDSKDRLTVPSKFRAALSDGVVLAAGLDPCVWVFPTGGYEGFSERFIGSTSPLSARGRTLRRHFHGNSYDEKLDSAGRIRMPKHLVEHAKLGDNCVVIGMDDYFEVWDPKRWTKVESKVSETVGAAAEKLAEGD
jgi:transcriptional regulator MraZ